QALLDANAASGADTITFAVAGTINVQSWLPNLSDPTGGTCIDGTTAPGYAGAPVVTLQGMGSNNFFDGLVIYSANNEVRGLQLNLFNSAIYLYGAAAENNIISGNYLGTDGTHRDTPSVRYDLANYTGVVIAGA